MQSMIPALTDRQRFWLKHIQACETSGKSIAAYSAEQGIAARAMYGGKKVLVKKGVLATTRPAVTYNKTYINTVIPEKTTDIKTIRTN